MDNDYILILDLGGAEAVELARKLRSQRYYTQFAPAGSAAEKLRREPPRGIVAVGGDDAARRFPRAALESGLPVLALGGAARRMLEAFGARSEGVLLENQASQIVFQPCPLFDQLTESDRYFTRVDGFALPTGFRSIATTLEGGAPAFADPDRRLYGLQFYPEANDPDGTAILSNFAEKLCGCTPSWTLPSFIEREIEYIRGAVGDGLAMIAVSGGVDSSACAMLMKRALGDRVACVFIDNGLLREGEAELVSNTLGAPLDLICVDARQRMLERLQGVDDPVEKRRIVHAEHLAILREVRQGLPEAGFFADGAIYSDLLTHAAEAEHQDLGKRLHPLRMLFKDESRQLGAALGLPQTIVARQPFPEAGLAGRVMGVVTPEKLDVLRKADAIFREEILLSGQQKRLSHFFAVLDAARTLGRRSGATAYEHAVALRAVMEQSGGGYAVGKLPYDLLDRVAGRIIAEVPGVNRVTLDISASENTAIEWE